MNGMFTSAWLSPLGRKFAPWFLGCLMIFSPRLSFAADSTSGGSHLETATIGLGCFWCAQALYEKFTGVTRVVCGYAGGHTANPTYEDVCTDQTGHAEVVQITFDPAKISYQQLLEIFWDVHDPTTLDQQGDDVGTQYRSIILYETPEQKKIAEESKKAEAARLGKPVTTEIVPLTAFYRAEEYHQDYFRKNPHAPYCAFVISPKVQKLEASPPPGVKLTK
jgi:peptide-methionine (S)-S-oxide reductase